MQSSETINYINSDHNPIYEIKNIEFKDIKQMTDFWDFNPSWQNSFDAINRNPDNFIIKGAFHHHKALGYFVLEPNSGDITQIAVDKQYRRKGVGSLLFKEAVKSNKNDSIKIVNTDVDCLSITEFLKSKNILIKGKQLEMIKKI
jgi:ribosomal protein S18 acetylase RimI-like enzyme